MRRVPAGELSEYIGKETGRSEWLDIDQDRITQFAEVTEDRQWIHVDRDAATQGPFGSTIAHGFLTMSLLTYLTASTSVMPEGAEMFINYGSDKVRFLNPVRVGSRIRAISTLKTVAEKAPGRILITSGVVVEIDGEDKPALVADILTLAVMAHSG